MKWKSNNRILTIIILIFSFILLSGCKEEVVALSKTAPNLAVFDSNQKEITLSKFNGKPMIIDFWSIGCGPCMAMMPELEKTYKQYKNQIIVIGINTDQTPIDLNKYAKKMDLSFPLVKDQLNITKERYQVIGTPTTFFIDKSGKVQYIHQGYLKAIELSKWISTTL